MNRIPAQNLLADTQWMNHALTLAKAAADHGEVPVGALIVRGDEIVSQAYNCKETLPQATAHAEILAIEQACQKLGRWRLHDCTLYVTLEPCLMCAGAIVQSRVATVVYGAADAKAGAIESIYRVFVDGKLNHHPEVRSGVMGDACGRILSDFFRERRRKALPLFS